MKKSGYDGCILENAPEKVLEYIVSNTTEAAIVYEPACELEDLPCAHPSPAS